MAVRCVRERARVGRSPVAAALRLLAAALVLAVPGLAQASLALTLITGGATFLGVVADTVALYAAFGSGPSDDHPLWGDSNSSPTLKIVATETTFDLLLQQPNDVSEFEDDLSVQLQGVVSGPIHDDKGRVIGNGELWAFSLTLEADLGGGTTDLDAQGHVQHLYAPHPGQGEQPDGALLPFTLSVAKSCTGTVLCTWGQGTVTDKGQASDTHQNGPHQDTLSLAQLSFKCCGTYDGSIDNFQVQLKASHPVPEPASLLLLGSGMGVLAALRGRRRPAGPA